MLQRGGDTRWWPALDGLRGLAVIAVVAYHLDESAVPGGFLGVSLFFSISGFLIVGQLAVEREGTGDVDLRRFWTRRLRRLAPAFSVTVLATVLVVAAREPDALDRVVGDALAGFAYVANWRDAAAEVAYADRFGESVEPLAHLWSLSIEEQVYVVVPLFVAWWGVRRTGWVAGAAVAVGLIVWWGSSDAYFATPVRLAEVVIGAMLGVRVFRGGDVPRWLVRAAVPAAAAALIVVMFVDDTDPRLYRLGLPAMAVIWVAVLAGAVTDGALARALALRPLRWVGDRSYAIYLVHVPLIELTDWSAFEVVVVTVFLAEVSHRLVESPVRAGSVPVPALVAGTLSVVVLIGMVAAWPRSEPDIIAAMATAIDEGSPTPAANRLSLEMPVVVSASAPLLFAPTAPESEKVVVPVAVATTSLPAAPTEPADPGLPPWGPIPRGLRVVTVGDSTMGALESALEAFLAFHDGELVSRSVPGCSPLYTEEMEWSLRFGAEPESQVEAGYCRPSVARILSETGPVDVVVVIDHGMALVDHRRVGTDQWLSIADAAPAVALRERYERWVGEAADGGALVVLATTPPATPGSLAAEARGVDEAARVAAHNEIVRGIAERSPSSVLLLDFAEAVTIDSERYERLDGVHFSETGGSVAVVVDHLGPALGRASS